MEARLDELKDSIEKGEAEIANLEQEINELIRSKEDSVKGDLEAKELELKDREKAKAKAVSHLKTLQDNIKQEERKRKQIQKSLEVNFGGDFYRTICPSVCWIVSFTYHRKLSLYRFIFNANI